MTPLPFGQATRIGLLSMHPPVANPAQPTLAGETMDRNMSYGAAEASGMPILKVTLLVASVHSASFWAVADAASIRAPAKLESLILLDLVNGV